MLALLITTKTEQMDNSTIRTKVIEIIETQLFPSIEKLILLGEFGNLSEFETCFRDLGNEFLTSTAEVILSSAAENILPKLKEKGISEGFGKFEKRPLSIRIFTGRTIKIPGLYAKKVRLKYKGRQQLMSIHFGIHKHCSPQFLNLICAMSMLSPSFEITNQLLDIQGIKYDSESIRKLVLSVSDSCKPRQAQLSRKPNESLSGKRVLISLDGGRTRCRQYTGEQNKSGNEKYSTDWNEPKMFVIAEIDEEGNTVNESVIYGTMFGVNEVFELLREHLIGLDIDLAKQVQIAADGAIWIWNRTQDLLISLGVEAEKIVETVDYYHAAQHLHGLIKQLSKRKVKKENIVATMKALLWNGKVEEIVNQFNLLFKKKTKQIERDIYYFIKNKERMQYADFQANRLLVGSGIMESGIRRVINLRFKNTSSFWNKDNVEGLFFLRSSFLSGRWHNLMTKFNELKKWHN